MAKNLKRNNLLLLRILNGNYCQAYIAKQLNITQVAYSKMEQGSIAISNTSLNTLTNLYKMNVAELLHLDTEEIKVRLTSTESFNVVPFYF
jgi:transcriptional regulator with XRE-family HTH domain